MNNNRANLQLSADEMRLVSDPGWILTKNSILQKVVGMMGELAGTYRGIWGAHAGDGAGSFLTDGTEAHLDDGVAGIEPGDPKVSRGENYRGLPWVMLDFPRVFGREDVLAIRTMFWWGHGFNVTLHLKGVHLRTYLPVILSRRVELDAAGFHVGIHADEWRHEHTGEVYRPFSGADEGGFDAGPGGESLDGLVSGGTFDRREFFKLSAAVGLDRWMEAPELLAGLFGTLVRVLHAGGVGG